LKEVPGKKKKKGYQGSRDFDSVPKQYLFGASEKL